jgi:predicted nuclease with TOPRIM domain
MQIEQDTYLNKLVEVYQNQCNQYLQERVYLQAQLDLVLAEIEKLKARIKELDPKIDKELDVNQSTDT